MKKTLIIAGILIGIVVLFGWVSLKLSQEVTEAFDNLAYKLEVSADTLDQNVEDKYIELLDSLSKSNGENQSLQNLMADSLESFYSEYKRIIHELDYHGEYLEKSIIIKDPQTGEYLNKTELKLNYKYWMGTSPESNNGRGNGAAKELRERLNFLNRKIEETNIQIASKKNLNDWYVPYQIKDTVFGGKKKSWEEYTFDSPVIANLAVLEALKLDQAEKMKEEFDFYEKVIKKGH